VWAIPAPGGGSRAFCDRMNSWAQGEGQPGLGYIMWREGGEGAGPLANNIGAERTAAIRDQLGMVPPQWSVAYRFTIAAVAMALLARWNGQSLKIDRRGLVAALVLGIVLFGPSQHARTKDSVETDRSAIRQEMLGPWPSLVLVQGEPDR
jgi:glutathione S-transferase